jgi:Uma2 family endonuclease
MATVPEPRARQGPTPELHSGDRMNREEFHRIYETTPEDFKAELVGGTVYVASPLSRGHGRNHLPLGALFYLYEAQTPGVESGANVTVQLGVESETQPDLYLRILPECGGQSRTSRDDYVEGPPELIAEVAHSSRAIDLHAKREDYARHGVLEYLVLCVREGELRWFDLQADRELQPDEDGVLRVRTFPGLWIHREALLTRDHPRLMDTLQQGLASSEHAAFVARLASVGQGTS